MARIGFGLKAADIICSNLTQGRHETDSFIQGNEPAITNGKTVLDGPQNVVGFTHLTAPEKLQ